MGLPPPGGNIAAAHAISARLDKVLHHLHLGGEIEMLSPDMGIERAAAHGLSPEDVVADADLSFVAA